MPSQVSRADRRVSVALLAALAGLVLFLLPACHDSKSSRTRQLVELAQARARWADGGLTSYAVTQRRICFCPPPFEWTVVVENGQPSFVSAVLDPSVPDRTGELLALGLSMSVEDLFDWIESQIRGGGEIDVTYDADLGYPVHVAADPVPGAVDDEISWELKDVTPTGACTEIGCADAFLLGVRAPGGGFPAGDWTVTVSNWDDMEQCSFTLAPGSCGSGLCVENAGCGVFFDAPDVLVATLPPVFGADPGGQVPVGVTVEIDGATVFSGPALPTETRSQPNGPLCPPVCWTTTTEIILP
jgi:hypothetical protein